MTPLELKAALDRGDKLVILDVREPQEWQIARIDGAVLIPLGEVPQRYGEIDRNQLVVCQCRSGVRSAKAASFLRSVGFERVVNLTGGILRWSDEVDPTQPKY
jgi:adenylyltransferase/sulfurtransferase